MKKIVKLTHCKVEVTTHREGSTFMRLDKWVARCSCGKRFTNRLLSAALAQLDDHCGIAAVSHIHTSEMLSA